MITRRDIIAIAVLVLYVTIIILISIGLQHLVFTLYDLVRSLS